MLSTASMSNPIGAPAGAPVYLPRRRADQAHAGAGDLGSILVPGGGRPIRVKIASDRDEFEQAFRLVAARYRARGYDTAGAAPFRFTPFHALPGTVTFVAKDGDRVVATLSLVPDNQTLGLPMESIYGSEVEDLRAEGRKLGEVTSLAEDGLSAREFLRVFSSMIRLVCQYHVRHGGDSWVITVNPRHRAFYCKVLGFVPLGPCRSYSAVGDHPAEAFLLDMGLLRNNAPEKFQEIFGEALPRPILTPTARPADHAFHFAARSSQADHRTILGVLAAGRHERRSNWRAETEWEWEGAPTAGANKEANEPCGSWPSRRCSPIGADC